MACASLCGRTWGSRLSVTRTCPTRTRRTVPTRPLRTPETRTGSPSLRPLPFWNTTGTAIAFDTIERPVSKNMKPVNTTKPTSTSAPTVTSCLYVMSMPRPFPLARAPTALPPPGHRLGPNQRHLQVALEELQHRRVLRRAALLARPHSPHLRLPHERHAPGHPDRPADALPYHQPRH